MAITISGENNNDRILASDGVIDQLSGFNVVGVMTATSFTGDLTGDVTGNVTGNLTGNVNHTSNLLLQISGSEKFRVGNGGQLGIAGANYGSSGQVFTSGGSGSAPSWSTITQTTISDNANNRVITGSGTANTLNGEANFIAHAPSSGVGYVELKHGGSSGDYGYYQIRSGSTIRGRLGSNYNVDAISLDTAGGSSTAMIFKTGSSQTERLRIDSSGNLVTGGQTSPTSSDNGNIYIKNGSAIGAVSHQLNYVTNAVFNSAWKYITSSVGATRIIVNQSGFQFETAASGTAGNNITFSNRFNINNAGAIGVGGAYGSSGQVLTSAGSGGATTWSTITGTTINNNANNRLITGSGTANTLEGESDLTFDGNQLYIDCNNYAYPLVVNSTQSSVRAVIRQTNDANANSGLAIQKKHSSLHPANYWYGDISFEGWDGSGYHKASLIECVAEGTPANDNMPGGLRFSTNAGAAGVTERLRIKPDGNVEVKTGNLVMTSGKGIDFSADGSGTLKTLPNSFNAELLHDYENGTFTPNIQYDTGTNRYAGSNVSSATGEYIRIGDLVNFGCKITLTGNRDYSENIHLYIGGFPYNGLHSSQQSSMMTGWSGWACPTNDSNSSYKLHYCYHSYTTVNLRFSQSSGTGGISGFYVWGFYRTAP